MLDHRRVTAPPSLLKQIRYILADRCALKNTHAMMLRSVYLLRQEGARHKYLPALVFALVVMLGCAAPPAARGEEPATHAAKGSACARSAFRVIVDVGHTTTDPGAISARGATEYSFNLKLAEAIRQALVDAGFTKTVKMITATRPYAGLFERAARANDARPDLFLSIHHDSVPDHLLETWQYQGQTNRYCDRFSGYALFISEDNGDRAGSLAFGRLLGKELQKRGLHYTPHYTLPLMGRHRHELLDAAAGVYRYDQLVVLEKTTMPAVLLEAGSIVNRQEELELGKPERRLAVADAVVAAVADFCAARARPLATPLLKLLDPATAASDRAKAAPAR
jgi:N-acetylmuramoyl-L-alanine amidase